LVMTQDIHGLDRSHTKYLSRCKYQYNITNCHLWCDADI